MKTRILAALLSIFPAPVFAAPTLVGQWELTTAQPEMSPPEYVWFKADGTFEYIAVAAMEEPDKGRYNVQGTRITFSGATLYGAPEARIVRLEASKLILEVKNDSGGLETYAFHRASEDPRKPSPSPSSSVRTRQRDTGIRPWLSHRTSIPRVPAATQSLVECDQIHGEGTFALSEDGSPFHR